MTTTTTMTLDLATLIIRRKPQSQAQWNAMGDALALLGAMGYSDEAVSREARRELGLAELVALGQARVAAGAAY